MHAASFSGNADLNIANAKILSVNSGTIANDPVQANDIVNKGYVDSLLTVSGSKASVDFTTVSNLIADYDDVSKIISGTNLSDPGFDVPSIDNTMIGQRVLIKDQTNQGENGIYVIDSVDVENGWNFVRADDFNSESTIIQGSTVVVVHGMTQQKTGWLLRELNFNMDFGMYDVMVWEQYSGVTEIVAGDGLVSVDNNVVNVVGTENRISVTADGVDIASTYSGQSSITTTGSLTSGSIITGFKVQSLQGDIEMSGSDGDEIDPNKWIHVGNPTTEPLIVYIPIEVFDNNRIGQIHQFANVNLVSGQTYIVDFFSRAGQKFVAANGVEKDGIMMFGGQTALIMYAGNNKWISANSGYAFFDLPQPPIA
jgi:hypothetical protein